SRSMFTHSSRSRPPTSPPFPYTTLFRSASPWVGFLYDVGRASAAILPAAVLWGASFPLALASASSDGRESGRLVGEIYGANTIRSEEHTSELQSREQLVCRLLLAN